MRIEQKFTQYRHFLQYNYKYPALSTIQGCSYTGVKLGCMDYRINCGFKDTVISLSLIRACQ